MLAIVVGIPLAVALAVALGLRRGTSVAAASIVWLAVVAVIAVSVWAIYRPPAPQALPLAPAQALPSPTTGGPSPSPAASPSSVPSPQASPSPSGAATAAPPCTPSGGNLTETAEAISYQNTCLAAPADRVFTIVFNNEDAGTSHNIHIFSADPTTNPNATSFFAGQIITGVATATYHVGVLPPGTYFFHCDVHPTLMMGTVVSAAPSS